MTDKTKELETEKIGKLLLIYALPAVISQIIASVYNLVDRMFLGQCVSALAITGLGITMPVMKQQGRTVSWMVFQIHCERTNVYNIYKRKTIDTGLLVQISLILGHNFFADLADEIRKKRHEKTEM